MAELSLTGIDIVAIAVILVSAVFATLRGLVRETLSILGWLAGGYVALRFAPSIEPLLHGMIAPSWLARLVVVIGIFLAVFIPLAIVSSRISAKVKGSVAGPVDRLLGLVFGVGRGLVIVGIVYIAFGALVSPKFYPATLTKARLFPLIRTTSEMLRELVPLGSAIFANENSASGYGAGGRSALDTVVPAKGGSGSSSR